MSDWKILITDGLNENGLEILRAGATVEDCPGISADELLHKAGKVDALIVRSRTKVTPAVLDAAPRLKVVGRAGVGVDNIDLVAAKAHHVTVVNAPQSTSQAVAEHTLALILALARELPRADAAMKSGQWIKKELEGIELHGKTLGVIGLGNIGKRVAAYSKSLGMQPLAYDPLLSAAQIEERGAQPVTLDDLFARADFITIHVPLTADTRDMINSQSITRMKPGVRLLCTARGGIIDETALLAALESGQVAGAALDVFAKEPPGSTPLVAHPKVIATPHIAAQTGEAQARAAADIAAEVLAALCGHPLRWKVA
jgi:D-3-phosphoglycerate dehydrogenase / 2-oxoglutarate reductase